MKVYEAIKLERGSKVIDDISGLKYAGEVLVPKELEEGIYKVSISHVANNVYRIENLDCYIETRYCFEIDHYEDVVMEIESNYGYTIGKLYFD